MGVIIASSCILHISAFSAPVDGKQYQFKQPDGELVDVLVFGDEFYQRVESLDGYTLIRDPETEYICYADLNADASDFISTGVIYHNYNKNLRTTPNLLKGLKINKNSILNKVKEKQTLLGIDYCNELSVFDNSSNVVANNNVYHNDLQEVRGITIKIDFPDERSNIMKSELDDFLNYIGYNGYNNNGSVRDYFLDVSNGKVDYYNKVFYYMAAHNKDYYDRKGGYPDTSKELVIEALTALENNQEFINYIPQLTRKTDGTVAALNVMYAGSPSYGWTEGLWPHSWKVYLTTINGINFTGYQISSLNQELSLGTFAHENGHMLFNFPDMYDYTYTTTGLGNFCLMAYGGNDKNPVPPNPYLREKAGWTESKNLNSYKFGDLIKPIKNDISAYKYSTFNYNEFFMIENINRTDRYTFFPGNGIVIYHIDEYGNNSDTSSMSPTKHAMVSIEPADLFETGISYPHGSQNNMYPYKSNTSFTHSSVPNSKLWNGDNSGLNIIEINADGSFIYNYDITISPIDLNYKGDLQTIKLNSNYTLPNNVFVIINKYDILGMNLYSENKTINIVNGVGFYSIDATSFNISNETFLEVLVYENNTCNYLLRRGLIYPAWFNF